MTSKKQEKNGQADTLKREARAVAHKRLAEAHADELRALMVEEHEKRGVEYRPRLTEEERARQQVLDLFAKHPSLKDDLASGLIV